MTGIGLDEFLEGALARRRVVLSDLDGCLVSGGAALPHAARLVRSLGERLFIVSNNSADTAATLCGALAGLGLVIDPGRILLAGEATVRLLAQARPGARVALYASAPLRALAVSLGLEPDRERPDVAVLARAPDFSLDDLVALARLASRGVPVWLTNPDGCHPAPDGTPVPETGALFAALAAAAPVAPARIVGKPSPQLVGEALARAGAAPADAVLIGDTPETDGRAAEAAGVAFVLIRRPGGAAPAESAPARAAGGASW